MNRFLRFFFIIFVVFISIPSEARTIVLEPSRDIWTTSYYSYDALNHLSGIGGGLNNDELRVGGWGDEYRSLLQFNLSGVTSPVISATLQLYSIGSTDSRHSPVSMQLDRVTSDWNWTTMPLDAGTLDNDRLWWDDRPSYQTYSVSLPAPAPLTVWKTDITDLVNGQITGAYDNFGIQLRPESTSANFNYFASSEHANLAWRPKLILNINDTPSKSINHGLFIGADDPANTSIIVDFRQNAKMMAAAFAARPDTRAYTLTGDISLDSNGNKVSPITRSMIYQKLQSIRSQMNSGDSLTLYINNHGGALDFNTKIISSTGIGDEFIDVGEYLRDNDLVDMLRQFNGFRVTVFLDTCNGGGFWGGTDIHEAPPGLGYYDLDQLNNIALYSAAAEDKSIYAGFSSFSFWGKALLEAFKNPNSWSPAGLASFLEERTLAIAADSFYIGSQESPVWFTLALGDLVQPDMSLIQTFVANSVDFDMSAISLDGPDPIAQIGTLRAAVANIGPGKSLFNKMTNVQAYYEAGNIKATCSTFAAFIKQLNAQTGKKVALVDAEQLTASAEFIMAAIECPIK